MSTLSAHLGRRVVHLDGETSEGDRPGEMTLADLPRGATARIVGLRNDTDPASARRMFDLGFAPGAEVTMLRRAPMADPVVFRIAGYEIALRRAQARTVRVSASR